MPAEKAGVRPAWWKEKDGGAPLVPEIMPKKDSKTRHSLSGKEMEEMIWNRYHNTKWVGKAADLFVGGGNGAAQTRMQAWDPHKRVWEGSKRNQMSQFAVIPTQHRWWRRYHDFAEHGGDPAPNPRLLKNYGLYQPHKRGAITAMCA